jgi:hypothetical protein
MSCSRASDELDGPGQSAWRGNAAFDLRSATP